MKFHYSADAKPETDYTVVTRSAQAPCGARDPKNAGLILTSVRDAVTCDKCLARMAV